MFFRLDGFGRISPFQYLFAKCVVDGLSRIVNDDFYALRAIVVRGMDRHIDVIAGAARFQRIVHENPDRIDQFKFTRPAAAHGIRNMKMNRHPLLCGLAVFVVQKGGKQLIFKAKQ